MSREQLRFRAESHTPLNRFIRRALPAPAFAWRPERWPVVIKVLNPTGGATTLW
jgi:hypothetical protein